MTTYSPVFFRDLAERVITAYITAFVTAFTVGVPATDWATLKVAAISAAFAAGPAALSVLKGILAEKYVPGTVSPASVARR